jgi:peptidoglycan glycosyltransferase
MTKELRRVGIVVLLMFLSLFISTSVIQVFQVDSLKADGRNVRTLYDSYSAQRGQILVDGEAIARSVPVDDQYKFLREYTQGELYAPVTGYFTLNQGTAGVEGELNDFLSGSSNEQFLDQVTAIFTGEEPKGASVELTIDPRVQQAAWDALGDQSGSVVAIDPKTGAILAMVSKPSYDPNLLAGHDIPKVIENYDALLQADGDPLANRAIAGDLYFPGSVFKVLMTAAGIDSGKLTPESAVPNPAQLQLPGSTRMISNAGDGPCGPGEEATLATAFRLSCNVQYAQFGVQLGEETIREYAQRFGFGEPINVPMRATPSAYPQTESEAELMLSSFGQASVRVTPLQIAMLSAGVANDGSLMQPTVVERIIAPDLTELQAFEPSEFSKPISSQSAETVTRMMVDNVANGAASNARIDGVDVAGKTGTAENGEGEPYTLWFTGFAPANDPQVAIAVVVENGGGRGQESFGNQIAAPIAKSVLEAVLSR